MPDKFLGQQQAHFDEFFAKLELKETAASRYEFERLVRFMGPELRGWRVLDLGCGTGRLGVNLAAVTGADVTGIDMSEVAVKRANDLAESMNVRNFRAIRDEFKEVRSPGYFDLVLCVNMLHHTDERDKIAANVYASLKPGGEWIIFENNPANPLFIPFFALIGELRAHLTAQYLRSNKYSLARLARRNGFRVAEVKRHGFLPTMLYNYSPWFIRLNDGLNAIPVVNEFAAFHLIRAVRPTSG